MPDDFQKAITRAHNALEEHSRYMRRVDMGQAVASGIHDHMQRYYREKHKEQIQQQIARQTRLNSLLGWVPLLGPRIRNRLSALIATLLEDSNAQSRIY